MDHSNGHLSYINIHMSVNTYISLTLYIKSNTCTTKKIYYFLLILPIKIEFIWAMQCLEIILSIEYSIFVSSYTKYHYIAYTYVKTIWHIVHQSFLYVFLIKKTAHFKTDYLLCNNRKEVLALIISCVTYVLIYHSSSAHCCSIEDIFIF